MMKYWLFSLILTGLLLIFLGVMGRGAANRQFSQTAEITGLRNIGHQILLSSGDHTSRVLPVQELSYGAYRIHFEKPFTPVPGLLVNIFKKNFKSRAEYSVELRERNKSEIVYSFVLSNNESRNIVPCLERTLPRNYYELVVRIPSESSSSAYYLAGFAATLVMGAGWTFFRMRRQTNAEPMLVKESPSLLIGRFSFYPAQQKLELDGRYIELTGKESRLLTIFAQFPNTVIDRVRLQKEVWENEGVIVTRSLDMFISKLRKKLKDDPAVRIVNIHGKGYRLEYAILSE